MATERTLAIEIPELNGKSKLHPSRKCILELETGKASRGGVKAEAMVMWCDDVSKGHAYGLGGGGDFRKTYLTRPGVATQRRIDALHAEAFTSTRIEQIKAEVRAYYAAA